MMNVSSGTKEKNKEKNIVRVFLGIFTKVLLALTAGGLFVFFINHDPLAELFKNPEDAPEVAQLPVEPEEIVQEAPAQSALPMRKAHGCVRVDLNDPTADKETLMGTMEGTMKSWQKQTFRHSCENVAVLDMLYDMDEGQRLYDSSRGF